MGEDAAEEAAEDVVEEEVKNWGYGKYIFDFVCMVVAVAEVDIVIATAGFSTEMGEQLRFISHTGFQCVGMCVRPVDDTTTDRTD